MLLSRDFVANIDISLNSERMMQLVIVKIAGTFVTGERHIHFVESNAYKCLKQFRVIILLDRLIYN